MIRNRYIFLILLVFTMAVAMFVWRTFQSSKNSQPQVDSSAGLVDPDTQAPARPELIQPLSSTERARKQALETRKLEFEAMGYEPGKHQVKPDDPNVERKEDGSIHFVPAVNLADQLHQDAGEPIRDLEILVELVEIYRRIHGQNPVAGLNHEVTASFLAKNPQEVTLIDPSHTAINRKGELLDQWGTPFHFHGISSKVMEVQSAGPDQKFGTSDDLVHGGEGETNGIRP